MVIHPVIHIAQKQLDVAISGFHQTIAEVLKPGTPVKISRGTRDIASDKKCTYGFSKGYRTKRYDEMLDDYEEDSPNFVFCAFGREMVICIDTCFITPIGFSPFIDSYANYKERRDAIGDKLAPLFLSGSFSMLKRPYLTENGHMKLVDDYNVLLEHLHWLTTLGEDERARDFNSGIIPIKEFNLAL